MAAAFWNARRTTSPTRPMPCESLESIAITPRSCSRPSAAIVPARTRWRTIVESPCTRPGKSTCTAGTIARCSSAAWTPNGTVGDVEEVRIRSRPASASVSGQCPPPTPSTWKACHVRPAVDGDRVLDREQLVHAVRVHGELHVVRVGDVERAAQLLGPGADVLVDLEPAAARAQRLLDRAGARGGRAHEQADVERVRLERRPGRAQALRRVVAEVPDRAEVLHHERRQAARQRGVADLGREPVHVRVDAARRGDQAAAVDDGGRAVEHDVDRVHRVRVAGAPDRDDAAVRDADARAPHAEHRVEQQDVGDRERDAAALGAHREAVAHRAAHARGDAARVVALGLDREARVAEQHALVRHRGTHARVPARAPARARRARRAGRRRARRGRARRAAPAIGTPCSPMLAPGSITSLTPAASASRRP